MAPMYAFWPATTISFLWDCVFVVLCLIIIYDNGNIVGCAIVADIYVIDVVIHSFELAI